MVESVWTATESKVDPAREVQMKAKRFPIILVLVLFGSVSSFGEEQVVLAVDPEVDLTLAADTVRLAVAAFEEASARPLPQEWTPVHLVQGRDMTLAPASLAAASSFVISQPDPLAPRLMYVDQRGPHEAYTGPGQEVDLGDLRVIVTKVSQDGREVDALIRDRDAMGPLPAWGPERETSARVIVKEESRELIVTSPYVPTLDFALVLVRELNAGHRPHDAARRARLIVKPTRRVQPQSMKAMPMGLVPDSTESRGSAPDGGEPMGETVRLPDSVMVTLRVVQGRNDAVQELNGALDYESSNEPADNPRIGASSGTRGTSVEIGKPGDRFQARLSVLEAERKVSVESEALLRIPVGGRSRLSLSGPRDSMEAWVSAEAAGPGAVVLEVDQSGGDWSSLGALSTRVRIRDGQTVLLAQNSTERTMSQASRVPVLSDVPVIGPVFRKSKSVHEVTTYALFATAELE